MITLRPHHVLCICNFKGRGYSAPFVQNMEQIIESLEQGEPVRITLEPDSICRACPNAATWPCKEKAARYDESCMEKASLHSGQTATWSQLKEIVYAAIIAPETLGEICGDCQWKALCLENNT